MKNRILAIALCICLVISAFNGMAPMHIAHGAECSCGALDSIVHTEDCALITTVCNCEPTDENHTPECALNTAVCTCDALSQIEHSERCLINCTCNGTTSHDETCPVFDCGCPDTDSDGKRDHVNTCRQFKPTCAHLDECIDNTHQFGCPLYERRLCEYCGFLFGEHHPYCHKPTLQSFKDLQAGAIILPDNISDFATIVSSEETKTTTITLNADFLNPIGNNIFVPTGYTLNIDLNGHILTAANNGTVITNFGTLEINDSNPNARFEGTMVDRGYYFFDDDSGKYFHSTRNAKDAIWVYGGTDGLDPEKITYVYGGMIYGGEYKRNYTPGDTYEQMLSHVSSPIGTPGREYFTYLIENNTFSNTYARGGAGIFNCGSFTMNGGTIVGCNSRDGEGSAVLSTGEGTTFTMNGGDIMYNYGGATVSTIDGAEFIMNKGVIFRNIGVGNGAVEAQPSNESKPKPSVTIGYDSQEYNESIITQTASEGYPTVSYMSAHTKTADNIANRQLLYNNFEIDFPLIDSNISLAGILTDGNGGGIYAESTNFTMHCGIISNNWAHYRGGGIDIFEDGDVTLSGNILIKNNYCEYKGGGISVRNPYNDSTVLNLKITSDTVKIIGNKAGYGGGIHVSYGDFDISGGLIEDNESTGYYVYTTKYSYLLDGTSHTRQIINFDGSENDIKSIYIGQETGVYASSNAGGGVYIEGDGNATISGTAKITKNMAKFRGGGLYLTNGTVTMNGGEISYNLLKKTSESDADIAEDEMTYDVSCGFSGVTDGTGGGVHINKGQFIMNDGIIAHNAVWSQKGDGGGVYISAQDYDKVAFTMNGGEICYNYNYDDQGGGILACGDIEMNGGSIHHNQTRDNGGGVYVDGQFTMTGGDIHDNTAHNYIGGGVYCYRGKFTMSDGKIYNNVALRRNGGGVYIREADFTMTSGEIYQNHADGSQTSYNKNTVHSIGTQYGSGGAICIENGNASITGQSIIRDNTAGFKGGAIYAFRTSESSPCEITVGDTDGDNETQPKIYGNYLTCNFTGSYVLGGGAICIEGKDAEITINSGKIYQNKTSKYDYVVGGAMFVLNNTQSTNTTSPALLGAAKVTINGGEIYENQSPADQAGMIYIRGDGILTVNGGNIHHNTAYDNGGFAYLSGGTMNIYGGDIHDNTASQWIGGAVCLSTGTINMYGGNIYANKIGYNGSANASRGHGGAFYITSGTFNMYGGKIYSNQTGAYGNGGAICIIGGSAAGAFNMYGGEISDNISKGDGGAIFVNKGTVTIGKAKCDGSSNDLHNTKDPTQSMCGHPIIKNNSTAQNGGAICVLNGTTKFYCGDITSNKATNKGGAMYVGGGTVDVTNGNISANTAKNAPYGNTLYMAGGTVTYLEGASFADTVNSNTGVVVTKGTLAKNDDPNATPVNSLYFTDREDNNTTYPFIVPYGEQIILPDGIDVMGTRANHTFIGWQYPDVSDYVRKPTDYMFPGDAIDVDDNSAADKMTIYGVWANNVNSISYYKTYAENSKYTNGYTTSYNYQTSSSNVFSLPSQEPVLIPGYTFEGWTMQQGESCEKPCNANWNISKAGDPKNAGDTFETKGKFGNLHFVANWSATITYEAVGNGTLANNTQSGKTKLTEAIEIKNGAEAASGVVPTAAENHIFVGWYADKECQNLISTDINYKPVINSDGYYDYLNYYAKFEIQYTDLIITTSGADADQSFVFTVTGTPYHTDEPFTMQVFVIGGNNSVTVKHIPAGNYDVYENNYGNAHQGDKWSWRYEDTQPQNTDVNNIKDGAETSVDEVTFYYNNKKSIKNWISGFSKKLYTLISGN